MNFVYLQKLRKNGAVSDKKSTDEKIMDMMISAAAKHVILRSLLSQKVGICGNYTLKLGKLKQITLCINSLC